MCSRKGFGGKMVRGGDPIRPNRIMTGNIAKSEHSEPKVSLEIMDIGREAGFFLKKPF